MASTDVFLKRAVLGLSVGLVLLLTGVAVYSLLNDDEPAAEPELTVDDDPAAPDRPYPGERLEIGDSEFPLTIGCLKDRTTDDVFLVIITNRGASATDYLVSASLSDDAGETVEAMARVEALQPGEEREVVLRPEDEIDSPSDCRISAVQGDRRVLLSSGS